MKSVLDTEIRCSDGVFRLGDFLDYIGMSYNAFTKYMKQWNRGGCSKDDVLEGLILCRKIKKRLNLKYMPKIDHVVKFQGEYYPSVSYVIKMKKWKNSLVRDFLKEGLTLDEIGHIINKTVSSFGKRTPVSKETYDLLKSREDANSKVRLEGDYLSIEIDGKVYNSLLGLAKDYGMSHTTIRDRLRKGCSISEAIGVKRMREFTFLGINFSSVFALGRYYNLDKSLIKRLVNLYGIDRVEKLFAWLTSIEKESGVDLPDDCKWNYLLKISRNLRYNKEDIIYQIRNYDKLDEDCSFYLGGKSYKYLKDFFHSEIRSEYLHEMIIDEDCPLCIIADMKAGTYTPELSYKSPNAYLYLYYRQVFYSSDVELEIEDIRNQFKKGYSADEILSTKVNYMHLIKETYSRTNAGVFIREKLGGVVSKERMLEYFNSIYNPKYSMRDCFVKNKFLQYSNVEILRQTHEEGNLQYFLCRKGTELEYLSGTELLDIALESVKGEKKS